MSMRILVCAYKDSIHSFIRAISIAPLAYKDSIHSFIQAISIAPLQVHYYSEALPTQHGYCVRASR